METGFIKRFSKYCGSGVLAWLIIINTGIWIAGLILSLFSGVAGHPEATAAIYLSLPAEMHSAITRPWSILTYMVTQYSFLHYLFNMLWLLWFGRLALTLRSGRDLLVTYVCGGIAGGILYLAFNALFPSVTSSAYLCGASAAVIAVITAAAVTTPDMRVQIVFATHITLKWLAAVCIILTLIGFNSSPASQTAHCGGIIAGAAYALARKWQSTKPATPRRRPSARPKNGNAFASAATSLSDAGRLDALLDKIRLSGYSSLLQGEKNELILLSKRLKKD